MDASKRNTGGNQSPPSFVVEFWSFGPDSDPTSIKLTVDLVLEYYVCCGTQYAYRVLVQYSCVSRVSVDDKMATEREIGSLLFPEDTIFGPGGAASQTMPSMSRRRDPV